MLSTLNICLGALLILLSFPVKTIDLSSSPLLTVVILLAGVIGLVSLTRTFITGIVETPPQLRWVICTTIGGTLILFTGYWYGFALRGPAFWEFRDSAAMTVSAIGITLVTSTISNNNCIGFFQRKLPRVSPVFLASLSILFFFLVSSYVARWILDGIPHMNDTATYLMQGRILWSGRLALPISPHPELFYGLRNTAAGPAGYYPSGWSAILGFFDFLGAAWLANPILGVSILVVTYMLVRDIAEPYVAAVTVAVLALSPWFIFNAADQLTHVASTFWLLLFFFGFQRTLKERRLMWPMLSGAALSAAILTRPQDALIFALPCIAVATWYSLLSPRKYVARFSTIAIVGLIGVGLYLLSNWYYSGDPFLTQYGKPRGGLHQPPSSALEFAIWVHESVSDLSLRWFGGVFPVVFFVLIGLWFGQRQFKPARLFLLCSASLCVFYGLFVFVSRSWMGPRWYLPLAPAIAFLVAIGLVEATRWARHDAEGSSAKLARAYLALFMVTTTACWTVAVPVRLWNLATDPPHGVSPLVVDAARSQGLRNAVVGLPLDYYDPGTKQPSYKIPRNGIWAMTIPFEENDVIYVAAVTDWVNKARELWPDRTIYEISSQPGDFSYRPISRPENL